MKRYISAAAIPIMVLLPALAHAQQTVVVAPETSPFGGYHFFIAVVAGLILAIAFQLVLTTLSVAAGVTAIGDVSEPSNGRDRSATPSKGVGHSVRKMSNAFGAWSVLTASIALFFASWLAVELTLTASSVAGAVLGLVIWGLFYFVLMTVEASAISSLAGSLFRFATTGLRAVVPAATSLFTKSPERRAVDTAHEVAGAVREELFRDFDVQDLRRDLRRYVQRLEKGLDPKRIARELGKALDETELRAIATHEGPFLDRDTVIATLSREPGMTPDKARSAANAMEQALHAIREERATDKDKVSTAVDAALRVAGMSPEEATEYRARVERYLRETGRDELHPDAIKRDLELLLRDPKGGYAALKDRVLHFDRNTVTALLSQRSDISPDEANKIVGYIEQGIQTIVAGASALRNRAGNEAAAARWEADLAKNSVVAKMRGYFNTVNDPRLRYEDVRDDIQQLLHDPKAGADALLRRLKSLDRNTLVSILASREDMSREDAEHLVQQVESVRDELIQRAEKMKYEVERRVEDARREALVTAEETRKTAAGAAWWAFGTAVVSGIAATLGGLLAVADRI